MSELISLSGLTKAEVLCVLYNASKPLGMGFLHYNPFPMPMEEAEQLIAIQDPKRITFDYVKGRVMKIDLNGDDLDPRLYDRENGPGAAARAIDALRQTKTTNPDIVQEMHKSGIVDAARDVRRGMDKNLIKEVAGGVAVFSMGLSDVKDVLQPKVEEALRKVTDQPDVQEG